MGRQVVKTAQSVRLDDEQAPAADVVDAMQLPRLADLVGAEYSMPGAPKVLLVLAANESLEVQAPYDVAGLHQIKRRKRDGNGSRPAILRDASLRGPNSIPPAIAVLCLASLLVGKEGVSL